MSSLAGKGRWVRVPTVDPVEHTAGGVREQGPVMEKHCAGGKVSGIRCSEQRFRSLEKHNVGVNQDRVLIWSKQDGYFQGFGTLMVCVCVGGCLEGK